MSWAIALSVLTVVVGAVGMTRFVRGATLIGSDVIQLRASVLHSISVPSALFHGAEMISMDAPGAPRFRVRTNGVAWPGYAGGWFRTMQWERAFALITDGKRVVHVPPEGERDYHVFVSAKFLEAIDDG
ncbi:MAG: hypothetical protein AAGE01_22205 [Pseudomonadota bacterium]